MTNGDGNRGYGYAGIGTDTDDNGVCIGGGLVHDDDMGGGEVEGSIDLATVDVGMGHHEDIGGTEYDGLLRAHASLVEGEFALPEQPGLGDSLWDLSFGGGLWNADAGIYDSEGTFSAGAGVSFAEAHGGIGTTPDASSGNDTSVHAGLSVGPGLGVRLHHGDADDDHRPEYGFGFDLGAISFDILSEMFGADGDRGYDEDSPEHLVRAGVR